MSRNENVLILKDFDTPSIPGAHYCLICLTGNKKGDTYFLRGNRLIMGRSESVDICIYDNKSSREHAELIRVGGSFVITDLGSQNGVLVNDQKITQKTLEDGDKIIVGSTVYKFVRVEVDEMKGSLEKVEEFQEVRDQKEVNGGGKSKKTLIYAIIAIMLLVLMLPDESTDSVEKRNRIKNNNTNLQDDIFSRALAKKKKEEDRELKSSLDIYLQRGLRELREKNYFRAIEEFDSALRLSPNNNTVDHYRNLAKQKLDSEIQENFISAAKDKLALRYEKAVVSYCNIIRLLQDYPDDADYKKASGNIRELEVLLGKEKDEIKCF